jgi:hypothetical protein
MGTFPLARSEEYSGTTDGFTVRPSDSPATNSEGDSAVKGQGNWSLSGSPGVLRYEHKGGVYAVEATSEGWIVLENGRQIGEPFPSSDAAGEYVEKLLGTR